MRKSTYKIIITMMIILFVALTPNLSHAAKVSVGKVKNVKVVSTETTKIKLKWSKVKNATKYQIYICNDDGRYVYKTATSKTSITLSKLKSSKTYKIKIRAYRTKKRKKYYGGYSSIVATSTKPGNVKKISVNSQTDTTVNIVWSSVTRAAGYRIYILNSKTNKFDYYGSTSNNSATVRNLKPDSTYKIKVRAYNEVEGKKYYGGYSPKTSISTYPAGPDTPSNFRVKENDLESFTISWNKANRASGYEIYRYNSSNNNWEKYKELTETSFKLQKSDFGVKDKFRVRSFANIKNRKYYSAYSNTVDIPIHPNKVSGLKISGTTANSMELAWNKTNYATGYAVYLYNQNSQSFKLYKETTNTTININNLDAAKFYKVYVKAYITINGEKYYGEASNPISQKTKSTKNAIAGIDVSSYQKKIDWNSVKNAGIDFAILRCGYGQNDKKQDDSYFNINVNECERLGIPYGVYIYSYALTTENAESEAEHALRLLQGHNPKYGVWFDMEDADGYKKKNGMPSNDMLVDICVTFCEKMIENGYNNTGIYANLNWLKNKLNSEKLDKYSKWVAHWSENCGYDKPYGMWQYSSTGTVDGISGNVDLDIIYLEK